MSESRIRTAKCEKCGTRLRVKTRSVEKDVSCPKCHSWLTAYAHPDAHKVDAHTTPSVELKPPPDGSLPCPNCGEIIMASQPMAGPEFICPHCEQRVKASLSAALEPAHSNSSGLPFGGVGLLIVGVCYLSWWVPQLHYAEYGFVRVAMIVLNCIGSVFCFLGEDRKRQPFCGVVGIILSFVALLVAVWCYFSGSWPTESQQATVLECVEALNNHTGLLAAVTDHRSAAVTLPVLERSGQRLSELRGALDQFPSRARKALAERYRSVLEDASRRHWEQVERLIRSDVRYSLQFLIAASGGVNEVQSVGRDGRRTYHIVGGWNGVQALLDEHFR